jgi:hypothetical protein
MDRPHQAAVVRKRFGTQARERGWEPAVEGDADGLDAIDRHIERFGSIGWVWHELASDLVHIDVHVVEPRPERPYFTLVTSGMSDRPMTVPTDLGSSHYCELMLCLPADWPMSAEAFQDQRAYWPIGLLKTVARLPHEYNTWIAQWHSVPDGDPAQPTRPAYRSSASSSRRCSGASQPHAQSRPTRAKRSRCLPWCLRILRSWT